MQYAYCTKLVGGHIADSIYLDWLVAFPTIPPEHRHPTPYVCGTKALKARGFDTGRCAVADIIMTPPELLPYIDETSLCDYIINEHIPLMIGSLSIIFQWKIRFLPCVNSTKMVTIG